MDWANSMQRKHESIAEPDRLCDCQAVFLVEVLSQYRARRAAKTLSPRFGTLYQKVRQPRVNHAFTLIATGGRRMYARIAGAYQYRPLSRATRERRFRKLDAMG
jgi:hypothetical protein